MADLETTKDTTKFARLTLPYAFARQQSVKASGTRFVHYSSAEAGLNILRSNEVWLRNALLMNDFSEVSHGDNCLKAAWEYEKSGDRLCELFESVSAGLSQKLISAHNNNFSHRITQSFLLSVSEHGNAENNNEDNYGRLSMWRAYGGSSSIAMVMKNQPFLAPSDALSAYTLPVLYNNVDDFCDYFKGIVERLLAYRETVKCLDPDFVLEGTLRALHFTALSTKHPVFSEEREWRVIYSPSLIESGKISQVTESIKGVPQKIYKLPFKDYPDEGFAGAEIPHLLDRIIIGPTDYPIPIYEAFISELEKIGVQNPTSKVIISNIPLRQQA